VTLAIKIPAPVQTTAVTVWSLSEDNMKQALIEARGDIFVASQILGITALRLSRAIQVSPVLQATLEETSRGAVDLPVEAISRAVEARIALYRVTGLDALHDLAAMPVSDNSAQNQVKLGAAARLAGSTETHAGGEIEETLRALNESYHQNAPRIRIVRERLTMEVGPGEREIQGESQSPPSAE